MAAHQDAIEPDLRQIVRLLEAEQIAATRMRVHRGDELVPVPDNAMIGRERLLNDRRYLGRLGFGPGRLIPLLLSPHVSRVGCQLPHSVQRDNLTRAGSAAEITDTIAKQSPRANSHAGRGSRTAVAGVNCLCSIDLTLFLLCMVVAHYGPIYGNALPAAFGVTGNIEMRNFVHP